MAPSASPNKPGPYADLGRYAGLGLQFVLTVALLGALGWWLDSKLDSSPWCLVAGVLAGGVIAFVTILRAVPPASRSSASGAGDERSKPPHR